jgi:hypothetical protein
MASTSGSLQAIEAAREKRLHQPLVGDAKACHFLLGPFEHGAWACAARWWSPARRVAAPPHARTRHRSSAHRDRGTSSQRRTVRLEDIEQSRAIVQVDARPQPASVSGIGGQVDVGLRSALGGAPEAISKRVLHDPAQGPAGPAARPLAWSSRSSFSESVVRMHHSMTRPESASRRAWAAQSLPAPRRTKRERVRAAAEGPRAEPARR